MPEPTLGRIVVYRSLAGVDCAAIITSVPGSAHPTPPADGHVHLHIFYPRDTAPDYVNDEGVPLHDEPNQADPGSCRWPERV